jgi:transcriptional regulator with XRE-family HTH domain
VLSPSDVSWIQDPDDIPGSLRWRGSSYKPPLWAWPTLVSWRQPLGVLQPELGLESLPNAPPDRDSESVTGRLQRRRETCLWSYNSDRDPRIPPVTTKPDVSFGILLRRWRAVRHLSQLDLALDADISTRHLSCVETGRAQPSREMVLSLAETLQIPLRERNALLLAAGYAPLYRHTNLDTHPRQRRCSVPWSFSWRNLSLIPYSSWTDIGTL